jgi:hypothetical protein
MQEETMRASLRRSIRRSRFAAVAVLGALALAAPISRASAATNPFTLWGGATAPFAFTIPATAFSSVQQGSVGGAVFSQASGTNVVSGCGSNRPAVIGGSGSLDQQVCGNVLAFVGPSIGQINSQVGPTIIGSVILAPVTVSAGPVVNTVP